MLLETFIKGIEVLDKAEINDISLQGWMVALLVFFIVAIVGSIVTEGEYPAAIVIISVLACCVTFFVFIRPTGEYKYKVTIDDTVSLNEFYEKYEIIDQEGKIYTIKFRNIEENK